MFERGGEIEIQIGQIWSVVVVGIIRRIQVGERETTIQYVQITQGVQVVQIDTTQLVQVIVIVVAIGVRIELGIGMDIQPQIGVEIIQGESIVGIIQSRVEVEIFQNQIQIQIVQGQI